LEGRVIHVQQSTIRKISDFFGVSYTEIETIDFEEKETIESSASPEGNMNPSAVPIIKESLLIPSMDKRIGELAIMHPLTYCFSTTCNLIGVLLEKQISRENEAGDLLIVKRGLTKTTGDILAYNEATMCLSIINDASNAENLLIIGRVIEERFNGK
jgi:hypothetical protein